MFQKQVEWIIQYQNLKVQKHENFLIISKLIKTAKTRSLRTNKNNLNFFLVKNILDKDLLRDKLNEKKKDSEN
jgi:hypothetical protein